MNPKDAIDKLLSLKWSIDQIAAAANIHRSTVYRLLNTDQAPTYANAVALAEIAKGRPRPPES